MALKALKAKVELRLDVGCGDEWFRRLDGVDDLAGLAQQLEQLRRLTNLEEDADSAWLKVCAGGSVPDEQQSEFSRRLLRHLDDVDRAVPPMRRPVDMLGECILKYFDGHGIFMGTIVEYDEFTGFRLQYDDGDTEDVSLRDLRTLMTPITPPPTGKPPTKPTANKLASGAGAANGGAANGGAASGKAAKGGAGAAKASSAAALAPSNPSKSPAEGGDSGVKKLPRELRNLAIPDRDWKDLLPPTKQATERSAKPVREDGDEERGELLYVASDDGPSSTLLPPTATHPPPTADPMEMERALGVVVGGDAPTNEPVVTDEKLGVVVGGDAPTNEPVVTDEKARPTSSVNTSEDGVEDER